ncbi:hypothetical protein IJ11_0009425, partial [Lacticaseibacillus paracasei]
DGMLCKHHFSKNGQVFFHIFWVVTLIMQSREAIALLRKRQRSQDQPQRFAHHRQQAADGSGRSRPAQS